MRYQAVLFDMDGTVLDTLGDLANACNHTLRAFGLPERTRTEIAHFLGNGAAWLISHAVPEGTDEARVREILAAYQPWYDAHCDILTSPYPGILELMRALRAAGVRQAVVSNKQDSAVQLLSELHFPGLLDFTVGESATVRRKPNPDAVLAALAAMGVSKEDAVYVGDTEVDIETAKNAGMDCIVCAWGFRDEDWLIACGAKTIIHRPEELLEILE